MTSIKATPITASRLSKRSNHEPQTEGSGAMTPEAQRVAIAEVCGLNELHHLSGQLCYNAIHSYAVPDYLNDLNAMHEAEKVMTELQGCIFCEKLFWIMRSSDGVSEFMKVHATAAQRAEAFLRTLNLWKDSTPE